MEKAAEKNRADMACRHSKRRDRKEEAKGLRGLLFCEESAHIESR